LCEARGDGSRDLDDGNRVSQYSGVLVKAIESREWELHFGWNDEDGLG